MLININLKSENLAVIGERKILLPEEKVLVKFTSSVYELGTLIVSVKNGEETKKYKTVGESIDITPLCKKAGCVNMEISKIIKCEPVKTWRTEPLILCEVKHGFELIPEIEALKGEINTLKSAIKELALLQKENQNI